MHKAANDVEQLNQHDAAFHREVIAATGNETLSTLLEGISSRTIRSRVWRGLVDADFTWRTLADHQEIYAALAAGDPHSPRPPPSCTCTTPSDGCATTCRTDARR